MFQIRCVGLIVADPRKDAFDPELAGELKLFVGRFGENPDRNPEPGGRTARQASRITLRLD